MTPHVHFCQPLVNTILSVSLNLTILDNSNRTTLDSHVSPKDREVFWEICCWAILSLFKHHRVYFNTVTTASLGVILWGHFPSGLSLIKLLLNGTFVFLWLRYFPDHNVLKSHPFCNMCQNVLPFQGWIVSHCMCLPHFIYAFMCQWMFGLPLPLTCRE